MTAHRISLSLLTGLILVGAATADEARGRIVRIDPDKHELRLEARGPLRGTMLNIKVDDKTEIFIGGQPAKLNELAPGNRVRVVYESRDGKPVAQVIRSLGLARLLEQVRTPERPAAPAPAPLKEGEGVSGVLQRVALTDAEIVVIGPGPKGPKTETTIAVPEEATIIRDGKKITLDDLNEGDAVTVKTEKRKGKLMAVSIQVGEAPAPGAAPAGPPRGELIPRLRQALKMADELLRQVEEGGMPFVPNRP